MPTNEEITRNHDSDPAENPWVNGPPPPETITIVPYNPEWPRRYQANRAVIGESPHLLRPGQILRLPGGG